MEKQAATPEEAAGDPAVAGEAAVDSVERVAAEEKQTKKILFLLLRIQKTEQVLRGKSVPAPAAAAMNRRCMRTVVPLEVMKVEGMAMERGRRTCTSHELPNILLQLKNIVSSVADRKNHKKEH